MGRGLAFQSAGGQSAEDGVAHTGMFVEVFLTLQKVAGMASIFAGRTAAGGGAGDGFGQELAVLQAQEALGRGSDKAGGLSTTKGKSETGSEFFPQTVEGLEGLPGMLGPQFDFSGENNLLEVAPGNLLDGLLDGGFILGLRALQAFDGTDGGKSGILCDALGVIKGGEFLIGGPDPIDGLLEVTIGVDPNVGNRPVASTGARDLPARNKDRGGGKGGLLGNRIIKGKGGKEMGTGKGFIQVAHSDAVVEDVLSKGFGLSKAVGSGKTRFDDGLRSSYGFIVHSPLNVEVQFVRLVDRLQDSKGRYMPHGQRDAGDLKASLAAGFLPTTAKKSEQARPIPGG